MDNKDKSKPRVVAVAKERKSADDQKKQSQTVRPRKKDEKWDFPYVKKNFIIAGIGLLIIIAGYFLMATGITEEPALPDGKWNNPMAVTIAPILLLIGYCGIIPYALFKYFGKKEES